jgi:NTE family protein
MRRRLSSVALSIALLAAACAHYPRNPQLAAANPAYGYRYSNLSLPRVDDTFVVLTFSGGGSRAAGFAYGVLRELQKTKMPNGRSMLDYIDVISSVSGGSFTAMQYGLRGEAGLDALKTDFLDKDIEGMLFRQAAFNPRNWLRLLSPSFHRIDLAQEIYDDVLFHGATFAELQKAQHAAKPLPLIIANATELEIGSRFEWTQDQFDPICSDLSAVKVSRAVAASSAFPGLLSAMVLDSYPQQCRYATPEWVPLALGDESVEPSRVRTALELQGFTNPERQFLHVMDGGIADNIGLRGPLHALTSTDTFVQPPADDPSRTGFTILPDLNRNVIRKLLFLVVSAEPDASVVKLDRKPKLPSLIDVIGSVIDTPMGNYSFDTIDLLRLTLQGKETAQKTPAQCQAAAQAQCPSVTIFGADQPQIGYGSAVVDFALVPDPQLRSRLNAIGTNFALHKGQLDDLVLGAHEVLQHSGGYRSFVESLGGTMPPP